MLSIVIPARDEEESLRDLLPRLRDLWPAAEVIVVDDGSTDGTSDVCAVLGVQCLSRPYGMGNGAAIKAGVRAASGDVLVCMDADGQHSPQAISALIEKVAEGFDMVVAARGPADQATWYRGLANRCYNWLASMMTGHEVKDLTSGFRAVRAAPFREFLHLLPNGFSYPTTITMAFFRSAYSVGYVDVSMPSRDGRASHLRPVRDGTRFLVIIFKVATLYAPLKVFLPTSAFFLLTGLANYGYTYVTAGRFTNMSGLLLSAGVIVSLIGLVAEQITTLMYREGGR